MSSLRRCKPSIEVSLSAVIQKFDYIFFPDTLNETVGAPERSPAQGEASRAPTKKRYQSSEIKQ